MDNIVVVGKFTIEERSLVKSLVASLTLKRMSDNEIIESIFHQTNKMISRKDKVIYLRTICLLRFIISSISVASASASPW